MKLLSILALIVGLYYSYVSLACFIGYAKTKEDHYKQASMGNFLLTIGTFIFVFKDALPSMGWMVGLAPIFFGTYLIDKVRSRQPGYKLPADSPRRPLILNIIIILSSIFLALGVFFVISLESRHDFLIKNGRTISGIVLDNDKQGSSGIIYYQFNDNGNLIRKSVSVKGVFQGRNVDEFKKGDKIEVLAYNGQFLEKDYYEQNIKQNILFVIVFAIILIWILRKRLSLLRVES